MDWTDEVKKRIVELITNGNSYSEICGILGISKSAFESGLSRYKIRKRDILNSLPVDAVPKFDTKKKLSNSDVVDIGKLIGESLVENYKPIKINFPKIKNSRNVSKNEEISNLVLSDVHVGMVNKTYDKETNKTIVTYDMAIMKEQFNRLFKAINEIHGLLSGKYKLKKIVIYLAGDILTNDRIFEDQALEIEKVVGLQIWEAYNYFLILFERLLTIYDEIEIVGICGNHGRSKPRGFDEPIENNFEYFLYRLFEKQFEHTKRVNVIVPDCFRYVHTVCGWKYLVEHGHLLNGYGETQIDRQVKDLYISYGGFDMYITGHLHELKIKSIGDKVLHVQNGCWISKDDYAWRKYKKITVPKQFFFGCNETRFKTWQYDIDLRG